MKIANQLKSTIFLAVAACAASSTWAQVPVDLTNSTLTKVSPTTFQIDNLNVPNVGNFKLAFEWNATTVKFDPVVTSLVANGSTCTKAVMTGNLAINPGNRAAYRYLTKSGPDGEFGGIQSSYTYSNALIVSWAKTATAAQNPYLVGRQVAKFDASKGYGVIGSVNTIAYPGGFVVGDLVEVTGSPSQGGVAILKLGTSASISLSLSQAADLRAGSTPLTLTTNCAPTSSGSTTGNLFASTENLGYALAMFSTTAGSLSLGSNSYAASFYTNWGSFSAPTSYAKNNMRYGIMGDVNAVTYENFATNQVVFVADIGDGVSITGVDAQGKAVATAVFYK